MDVVALEAVSVIMGLIMTMIESGAAFVEAGCHDHTAPAASVAPFFGGTESKPLIGWSRYGNLSR